MSNARATTNRAGLVRDRQQRRTQEKIIKSRQTATTTNDRSSTPIFTRGIVTGLTYPTIAPKKMRRQFNYTVGNTGAEIRIPSIPDIRIGWRFLSFILLIVCLAGLYFLFSSSLFQIGNIQLDGFQRLTVADINAVLEINGKSIVWLNPFTAKSEIEMAYPELKNVSISLQLPNKVTVSAIERQPVLAWKNDEQTYWIDAEGVLIPPRGEIGELLTIYSAGRPPLMASENVSSLEELDSVVKNSGTSGFSVSQIQGWGDQADPALVEAAFQLSMEIPPETKILYNESHGLGWKTEGGWDVFIGLTLNDITYKLKAYQALISKLGEEGITPSMVSIEHLHAPYYRE